MRRVLKFLYLECLEFSARLCIGKKYTYHQHKDTSHFLILIEGGH